MNQNNNTLKHVVTTHIMLCVDIFTDVDILYAQVFILCYRYYFY